MSALRARTAELEWARRAAADELPGTDWVEVGGVRGDPPYSAVERDGELRFRHIPYGAFVPERVADASRAAREAGELGLLETLERIFARPEWLVYCRRLFWTPLSPVPALLTRLVEAHGIGPEVHGRDPKRLARLAALLRGWFPRRGQLEAALALLERGAETPVADRCARVEDDAPLPPAPDEVLACRDAGWWRARQEVGTTSELRIEGGYLRFQPQIGAGWALLPEDVAVQDWNPDRPLSQALIRLIPPWSCLRLAAPAARPQAATKPASEAT